MVTASGSSVGDMEADDYPSPNECTECGAVIVAHVLYGWVHDDTYQTSCGPIATPKHKRSES